MKRRVGVLFLNGDDDDDDDDDDDSKDFAKNPRNLRLWDMA